MAGQRAPVHILMAEDDPEDEMIVRKALAEDRLVNELHVVHDGEELLQYLRRDGEYKEAVVPDLILLDLNMPRMDGREALEMIKQTPELRRIPVIVLATSAEGEDIVRSYDLGVNSYITKPVSFQKLADVIKAIGTYWFEIVKLPPNNH